MLRRILVYGYPIGGCGFGNIVASVGSYRNFSGINFTLGGMKSISYVYFTTLVLFHVVVVLA